MDIDCPTGSCVRFQAGNSIYSNYAASRRKAGVATNCTPDACSTFSTVSNSGWAIWTERAVQIFAVEICALSDRAHTRGPADDGRIPGLKGLGEVVGPVLGVHHSTSLASLFALSMSRP